MKFNNYLNEKFEAYIKSRRRDRQAPIPVFLNPTRKEIAEITSGNVRYIINFHTENIYVWDAMEAIHASVASQLKLDIPGDFNNRGVDSKWWSFNETGVVNGKLDELIVYYAPRKEKEPDLDWAKPYFNHIKVHRLK